MHLYTETSAASPGLRFTCSRALGTHISGPTERSGIISAACGGRLQENDIKPKARFLLQRGFMRPWSRRGGATMTQSEAIVRRSLINTRCRRGCRRRSRALYGDAFRSHPLVLPAWRPMMPMNDHIATKIPCCWGVGRPVCRHLVPLSHSGPRVRLYWGR